MFSQNNVPPTGNESGPKKDGEDAAGGAVRRNSQLYQNNGSGSGAAGGQNMMNQGIGVGGGFMMNKGGSWGGGQGGMPPSFRGGNNANADGGQSQVNRPPAPGMGAGNFGNYPNALGAGAGGRNGNGNGGGGMGGMGSFQDDDESINYLAARAHAAQVLAAEESRRLEENLMRLEMRRMMMGGGGGSGMGGMDAGGDQAQAGMNMNRNQGQFPNNSGMNMNSKSDDNFLMARAQKYNMPQNQMNMMGGNSENMNMNQHQHNMGGNFNWANMQMGMNNTNGFPMGAHNHNPSSFAPPRDFNGQVEGGRKSSGESAAGLAARQASRAAQPAPEVAPIAPPKPSKSVEAPRRPLSAYNIFFSEMRVTILQEREDGGDDNETENKTESEKTAGENGDADDAKKPAGGENAKEKEEPDPKKDMEAFTQNLMKKRLDKKAVKRVHRKSHGKVAFTTLAKTVGMRWRGLPEEKKKKYKDLAEIDRARYRKEKMVIGKALKEEAKKQRKEAKAARQNNMAS